MILVKLAIRRTLVIAAVVLSLAVGGLAVRAASAWTAASAPLDVPPVSAKTLSQQLVDEQNRSAQLEAQLTALLNQSNDLTDALQMARDRATADGKTAKNLQAQLAAAQKRLAALQRAAAARPTQRTTTAAVKTTKPSAHGSTGASGQPGSGENDD